MLNTKLLSSGVKYQDVFYIYPELDLHAILSIAMQKICYTFLARIPNFEKSLLRGENS